MGKNKVRLANGAWLSAGQGAGAGMGTGAAIGMAVGMPWLGAGIGALAGGTMGLIRGIKEDNEMDAYNRKQKNLASQNRIATDNAFLAQYNTMGVEGDIYAKGGLLKPIASDMEVAEGNTHEQGGIDIGAAEIEDGEVLRNTPEGTEVHSEDTGHAAIAESLGNQKAQLESRLLSTLTKMDTTLTVANQDDDRHKIEGANRKLTAYIETAKHLEQGIASIDQALDELFENQQSLNGGVGEEQQPMIAARGGLIKAGNGAYINTPKALDWTNDKIIEPTWNWTKNTANTIGTSIQENPNTAVNATIATGNLLSNSFAAAKARKVELPKPSQIKALTHEPNVRTSHIEAGIDRNIRDIDSTMTKEMGTNSANRSRRLALGIKGAEVKATVRGQADERESAMRRENLNIIAQTDRLNLEREAQYNTDIYNKRMGDISRSSAVAASALNDFKSVVSNHQTQGNHEKALKLQQMIAMTDNENIAHLIEAVNKDMTIEDFKTYLDEHEVKGRNKILGLYKSVKY